MGTIEAVSFDHATIAERERDLKTIFCQIDAKGSTLHVGLLLFVSWGLRHCQLGTWMPKKQEESISSFQRTPNTARLFGHAFGIFAQKATPCSAPLN
jgi:hypothetical protein